MIEHLSNFPDDVLAFVCKGQVTKADYDTVLIPTVIDGTAETHEGQALLRNCARLHRDRRGRHVG